ncbi:protein argonaute-2 (AGO2) [Vairimorpha necatrix]|uniref:Protein argonaute-2 (AGO2) n=1 Tax=Vairimorpha necatrix TaxID=6039 RepID=A0AAX4J824_9MICR
MELSNYPAERPKTETSTSRTLDLETNMFKYTGTLSSIHHYDVRFTPEINRKFVFETFMRAYSEHKDEFPEIAFDGVNTLVSTSQFQNKTLKLGKEKVVTIDIMYKNTYDMDDLRKGSDVSQHIQCLEVVTRYWQKLNSISDRHRVFGEQSDGTLSSVIELRIGLAHNIKLTASGFYLNVDTAFSGFYKSMPLLEVIQNLISETRRQGQRFDRRDNTQNKRRDESVDLARENLGRDFWYNFEKFIKNIKVKTNHRGPKQKELSFKASGILQEPASSCKFEMDGKSYTVAEYFAQTYGPLKFPNLPVVLIKKRGMELYFPIEVLDVHGGQRYIKKLDEQQTSTLIKYAAKPPIDRFRIIQDKLRDLPILNNNKSDSFGVVFESNFTKCTGKLLQAPKILFGKNATMDVRRGGWNLMGVSAYNPAKVHSCNVFLFREPRNVDIRRCIHSLVDLARKYGVIFEKDPNVIFVKTVDDIIRQANAEISLVVLPDKSTSRYEEVKRRTETETRMVTQCLLEKNFGNLQKPPFVGNLLLKINSKLGGENSVISKSSVILSKPTLVLGIDVNHPGIGDLNSPSIVAIVGGMNKNLTSFKTIIKQQDRRHEIVEKFDEDIVTMLKSFYMKSKVKPEQIVVFRDGVGDTMFQEVFHKEIIAIKEACNRIESGYTPKITFIVAQKRHSVRFNNPAANNFKAGENGNVPPGTVVEDIGHPTLFDFYLVSHHALQGTARPVRYLVLLNESGFKSEELYDFVYGICHNYARATKAVSVVPPIYYAHLAAFRGKAYLEKDHKSDKISMKQHNPSLDEKLFYV